MTDSRFVRLTDKQKRGFESKIREFSRDDLICPVCGNSDWVFNEHLSELRMFQYGAINLGSGIVPVVVATCRICSHVLLFNALQAGLIEDKGPDANDG